MELVLKMKADQMAATSASEEGETEVEEPEIDIEAALKTMMDQFNMGLMQIAESVNRPRQVVAQRDANGQLVGAVSQQVGA
jgi:hypothetical protein